MNCFLLYFRAPGAVLRRVAWLALVVFITGVPLNLTMAQAVAVTPDGGTTTVAPLSFLTYNFTVQNTGGATTSYSLRVSCPPPLSSCSPGVPDVTLVGGASTTVSVAYRSGPGSASGTLAKPALHGTLSGDALALEVPLYGVSLKDGALRAVLEGENVRIESFSARGGEGRLEASGTLPLALDATARRLVLADRAAKGAVLLEIRRLHVAANVRRVTAPATLAERAGDQKNDTISDALVMVSSFSATGTKPALKGRPPTGGRGATDSR